MYVTASAHRQIRLNSFGPKSNLNGSEYESLSARALNAPSLGIFYNEHFLPYARVNCQSRLNKIVCLINLRNLNDFSNDCESDILRTKSLINDSPP